MEMHVLNVLLAACLLGCSALADPSPSDSAAQPAITHRGKSPEYSSGDSEVYSTVWSDSGSECEDEDFFIILCGSPLTKHLKAPIYCRDSKHAHCKELRYVLHSKLAQQHEADCRRLCGCVSSTRDTAIEYFRAGRLSGRPKTPQR
ncbi:hypothetical protein JDV02_002931 [Purpureocillium takamizusanense]|uniref:Secreted protein n=1 Tax=Purpureocillium takamizusanense TaxID=2060973 RepID=A0A9Q8QBC7_9HYPO|nr:uncharacterized protein JDV02_002931 [Purpureocillium takamizusanense]UNI16500.1 hypothetical protein JDV02_002931 [Purpureocillium takamizusanense]